MCATCGCMGTRKSDKKQDAKVMMGMSPKQKTAFGKADAKMDKKKPSRAKDAKMDKALAAKIKAKKK